MYLKQQLNVHILLCLLLMREKTIVHQLLHLPFFLVEKDRTNWQCCLFKYCLVEVRNCVYISIFV